MSTAMLTACDPVNDIRVIHYLLVMDINMVEATLTPSDQGLSNPF